MALELSVESIYFLQTEEEFEVYLESSLVRENVPASTRRSQTRKKIPSDSVFADDPVRAH